MCVRERRVVHPQGGDEHGGELVDDANEGDAQGGIRFRVYVGGDQLGQPVRVLDGGDRRGHPLEELLRV